MNEALRRMEAPDEVDKKRDETWPSTLAKSAGDRTRNREAIF
jgi:hypothetical protein